MTRPLALLGVLFLSVAFTSAAQGEAPSWSSRMLDDVFHEPTNPQASVRGAPEGVILKSYQLQTIRVGAKGKSSAALRLLEKLLPAGSTLKLDSQSNSIHLLAIPSAHAAAWEFLSAIDSGEEPKPGSSPELPAEIREALEKIKEGMPNDKLSNDLSQLNKDLVAQGEESKSSQKTMRLLLGGTLLGLVLLILLPLLRSKPKHNSTPSTAPVDIASLLAPENIGPALEPMQKQLQQEMLGALNAAAIRMEAWYKEHQASRDDLLQLANTREAQLEDFRRQMLEENRALLTKSDSQFQVSASRIEEGVKRISEQNDRIGTLTGELERTVRELDASKDQIIKLQSEMEGRGAQLEQARQVLSRREGDIVRQQAKLAALSLILEKGTGLPELSFGEERQNAPETKEPAIQFLPSEEGVRA